MKELEKKVKKFAQPFINFALKEGHVDPDKIVDVLPLQMFHGTRVESASEFMELLGATYALFLVEEENYFPRCIFLNKNGKHVLTVYYTGSGDMCEPAIEILGIK